MKLIDISPPLQVDTPIWPGDTAFDSQPTWVLDDQCPVNVSRLVCSTHVGAHADAPLHYDPQGLPIGQVDLLPYIGACRVVHCLNTQSVVDLPTLQVALKKFITPLPPRVLIRTYAQFPINQWDDEFCAINAEVIHWLHEQGVILVGIDSASIDPMQSKTLNAHHAVQAHDMRILENLYLDQVNEGDYELIALPLKLMHLDASPVRAILRSI